MLINIFSSAPEEKAHRKWHRGRSLPGRVHTLCPGHDCLQLPACVCAGAGWEPVYRAHNIQGTNQKWGNDRISAARRCVVTVKSNFDRVSGGKNNMWSSLCFIFREVNQTNTVRLIYWCAQVSVTAREDVPPFGPPLPNPAVFKKVRGRVQSVDVVLLESRVWWLQTWPSQKRLAARLSVPQRRWQPVAGAIMFLGWTIPFLDSRMTWLEFGGQSSRSLWPHKVYLLLFWMWYLKV